MAHRWRCAEIALDRPPYIILYSNQLSATDNNSQGTILNGVSDLIPPAVISTM
jgi:hypothetical protein